MAQGVCLHVHVSQSQLVFHKPILLNQWSDQHKVHVYATIFMAPFEEGGAYCFAHVGRYVNRYVGQSPTPCATQEHFALEASNLVGRWSLICR